MEFWSSFWDIIWWFFFTFIFVAYLVTMIGILMDVFRDRGLSGWAKAIWVVCLIFVPFITAVVYLIARGQGMAERSVKNVEEQKQTSDAYIRSVAGSSPSTEIEKASQLLQSGIITNEEFNTIKTRALS
ncbi:SHOCT domain-containing protein [Glutamicibacter sp.]|uniref:SHOCT domain-containing protein n=1 Tax=Glutamicibacter sp. TaxID=1931995 RepID=UPI0028BD80F9|nr:SHOCT domain-containing protein [Glutamicibacter sp.]